MLKKLYILSLLLIATLNVHAITVESTAGKLYTVVTDHNITSLTVTGQMDARDFKFITDELSKLKTLILSDVTIAAYTSTLDDALIAGTYQYPANVLPYCALSGMITLQSLRLPNNITAIDYGAMAACTGLTSIYFPYAIERIGDDAFNSCTALTQLNIGGKIKQLGSNAFAHCTNLVDLTVNSNSPLVIGDQAFADCRKLANVTIGPKVTAIGDGAFNGCSELHQINFMDGSQLEDIGDKAFYNSSLEELNFDQLPLLNHLGAWALARTRLKSVNLPAHVKRLDEGTFFYTKRLTNLQLPKTLTYLPDYMLAGCERIKGAPFMTQDLGNIGDFAIYNQSQHESITVPYQVYYIGSQAMAGMIGLNEITSEPLQVPELGENVWLGINQSNVKLNVNSESLNDYKAAEQWMDFLVDVAQLRGDINNDGFVNTLDATCEQRYVFDGDAQGIDTNRTDVNGDGEVNVGDIVSIYNIINGTEPVGKPYHTYFDDIIDGNGKGTSNYNVSLDILLDNTINYTAFQLSIATPSHITINSAKLSGRCVGHELYFKEKDTNLYSILSYSPAGDDIEGYEGVLLTLNISSTQPVSESDQIDFVVTDFVDQQEIVYRRHDRYINILGTTAIENITADNGDEPVNVYNTQGQLLRRNVPASTATQGLPTGIYIVGNKKVVIK
jgi:hypothetical protein